MEHKVVIRYSIPNKIDEAPFGTLYSVVGDKQDSDLYIQLSQDEKCPQWQKLGLMFEIILGPLLNDPLFISKCLDLYKMQNHGKSDIKKLFAEI